MSVIEANTDKKICVVVDREVHVAKGKMASYVAHAALTVAIGPYTETGPMYPDDICEVLGYKIVVLEVYGQDELRELTEKAKKNTVNMAVMVRIDEEDSDDRVVPCVAFGPDVPEKVDLVTGNLKPF
ncbi:MAG: peptidyl-tRNA hydrolase [archaeon]|nr:peptidyl-tRNA hydrolase [archaeon]